MQIEGIDFVILFLSFYCVTFRRASFFVEIGGDRLVDPNEGDSSEFLQF